MFSLKVRQLRMGDPVFTMSQRAFRTFSRATKPCVDTMSAGGGWDTHGLPVEIEVEKKLGFTNKQQIEEYGIDRFNELCRVRFAYIQEWERLTDRIGYWVDLDTAYITYKNEYIESIWWILKNYWGRGLLYQVQGGGILSPLWDAAFRPKWRKVTRKRPTFGFCACRWWMCPILPAGLDDHTLDSACQRSRGCLTGC